MDVFGLGPLKSWMWGPIGICLATVLILVNFEVTGDRFFCGYAATGGSHSVIRCFAVRFGWCIAGAPPYPLR